MTLILYPCIKPENNAADAQNRVNIVQSEASMEGQAPNNQPAAPQPQNFNRNARLPTMKVMDNMLNSWKRKFTIKENNTTTS